MKKKRIFNDPLYGLIGFDHEIVYRLIDHPYFQRLRRIKQMGLSDYIYPGAVHTRFQHSIGAMYLMKQSVETLRWKGVEISDDEYKAVSIAILLHDLGHGPFSHALEGLFVSYHHEEISLKMMNELNNEFNKELDLAIKMYEGNYHRKFFHQLISGQLDVDRLDYLNRDSFFTGVAEGVIGYDRIIKMLNVIDDNLVVEEKAVYSIEKFLIARKLMYWQVYLHKTSIVAEKMIHTLFSYLFAEAKEEDILLLPSNMQVFCNQSAIEKRMSEFKKLDDSDIVYSIKCLTKSNDTILQFLSTSLIERKLFKILLKNVQINSDSLKLVRHRVEQRYGFNGNVLEKLIILGEVTNEIYNFKAEEILISSKNNEILPVSDLVPLVQSENKSVKFFVIYPYCS